MNQIRLISGIAYSLLRARWKQTLVAATGVTFSITMFITLLSFMNGLNDLLDGLILNRTPHIKLYNELKSTPKQPIALAKGDSVVNFIHSVKPNASRKAIHNSEAIIASLLKDPEVEGVAPKITTQVFYNLGTIDMTGVINGIDVDAEDKLFKFREYVPKGDFNDLKNIPNSIILGKTAADNMLKNLGDMVQVTTPAGERFQLKIVGFYQSGIADIDKVQSYTSIATAQKLIGEDRAYITDVQIRLRDMTKAPELAKQYAEIYETDAEDIQTANAQFETGSQIRTIISYAVGITLLIVAGFGIYNILNMMIYEKMDTIAILKATGFSGQDVKKIFIGIAVSIGLFGAITGLSLGYIMSSVIDQIPFKTAALPTIDTYPVDYNPKYYLIGILFSLITTYLAGLFPARKASKVDPVIIIRGK